MQYNSSVTNVNVCIPDCTDCPQHRSICFSFDNSCFLVFCGTGSWYEARMLCEHNRGDLALLKTKQYIDKITIETRQRQDQCNRFWIGFSTFTWRAVKRDSNKVKGKLNISK